MNQKLSQLIQVFLSRQKYLANIRDGKVASTAALISNYQNRQEVGLLKALYGHGRK